MLFRVGATKKIIQNNFYMLILTACNNPPKCFSATEGLGAVAMWSFPYEQKPTLHVEVRLFDVIYMIIAFAIIIA